MGNKRKNRPIFVDLDDMWIGAADASSEILGSSPYWLSVPQHEPSKSNFKEPYDYDSFVEDLEIQENVHEQSGSYSPSVPQHEASSQDYDERNDYTSYYEDPPRISSITKRPSKSKKGSDDGRTMSSQNPARHVDPPSQHEQEEAEETVRDILGARFIDYPTVQFILKLQATRMDPMEWVSVRDVIQREPEAGKSLFLLAYLLHKEDKAIEEEEQAASKAQLMSIREFREAKRPVDPWPKEDN